MNRRSIRFRLTAWYAVILSLTFVAVGIGVRLAIRHSINDTVDKELRSRLRAIRSFLQSQSPAGNSAVEELIERAALAPAGIRFRVADGHGRWVFQAAGTEAWGATPPDPCHLPNRGSVQTIGQSRKSIRVLSAAIPPGVVQIGMPTDEFEEMLEAFTWTAVLASPVLLILASVAGYWMSRRALAPVGRIARAAGEIEAQNLSARLSLPGTGDELEHLSATLNAMLARLEDSFRRITQFTADASHELRTPIAIIRTTAEVTRKRPRSEKEYTESLDRILAESERTTELIGDLLQLARGDANAEDMVPEPVALDELMKHACADAIVQAESRGINLTIRGSGQCTVFGEYAALHRLVLILLDNAIKYSKPAGEVQVHLGSYRKAECIMAMLEVSDSGIGIAAEDLPHIFERFYRASKDRSRKIDGWGLGLAIAESIVRRHGGEIQIESTPGAGSTARVFLPIQ